MPGSSTAPGRTGARNSAPVRIAFRQRNSVGARDDVDFAAQWLAYALPCRRFADCPRGRTAHGSGPMWFATPSSQWTCTTYSLPVSRRTLKMSITAPNSSRTDALHPPRMLRRKLLN